MMTQNDIEEALSRAYVFAVAGRAGVNISGSVKDYGTDGTFKRVIIFEGNLMENGFPLDFQLKASIDCKIEPNFVVYDMKADAYQKLAYRRNNGSTPQILILLALPPDAEQWMGHSEDALLIRQCCYWYLVDKDFTENTSSVRIRIPRSQQFTTGALEELLTKAESGELV
jgi:hypothetical protein